MPVFAALVLAPRAVFVLDGNLADVFQSPYIVPVFGTLMILGIVVAGIWSGVRTREMQSQERLAAIARGLQPEPVFDRGSLRQAGTSAATGEILLRNDGSGARRTGLILASIGVGLCAFFAALAAILQVRAILCGGATGLIPLAIGVGFLMDGRLRRVEFDRLSQTREMEGAPAGELRPLR